MQPTIFPFYAIKTHSRVSAAKKYVQAHQCVIYTTGQVADLFQPIITQKLWCLFLPNLHILIPSCTVPYIPSLKEIAPEIRVPETHWIFFIFIFFFAPNNKKVCKLCSCSPISTKLGTQVRSAT